MTDNTKAIELINYIHSNINDCKGIFNFTLLDGTSKIVKILNVNSSLKLGHFNCTITTFTNDINNPTTYNIYDITSIKVSNL